MKLELIRKYFPQGTNGTLLLDGVKLCATIELPWRNNEPRISCIPEGEYKLIKRYSPHFKWHLQVLDVPGRDLILMHPANDAVKELKGCIAPVLYLTGIAKGNFSVKALSGITSLSFPVLDRQGDVSLKIKNFTNEKNYKQDAKAYPGLL
jgi:Family of unknown function (DUF5675)